MLLLKERLDYEEMKLGVSYLHTLQVYCDLRNDIKSGSCIDIPSKQEYLTDCIDELKAGAGVRLIPWCGSI